MPHQPDSPEEMGSDDHEPESDTPRTDEIYEQFGPVPHPAAMAYNSLACELERENNELRAHGNALAETVTRLYAERHELGKQLAAHEKGEQPES